MVRAKKCNVDAAQLAPNQSNQLIDFAESQPAARQRTQNENVLSQVAEAKPGQIPAPARPAPNPKVEQLEAGCPIQRIGKYDDWVAHFETAMNALPEEKRAQSRLTIFDPYRRPHMAFTGGGSMPLARFRAAAEEAGHPIPSFSPGLIHKYVGDLRHLGMIRTSAA